MPHYLSVYNNFQVLQLFDLKMKMFLLALLSALLTIVMVLFYIIYFFSTPQHNNLSKIYIMYNIENVIKKKKHVPQFLLCVKQCMPLFCEKDDKQRIFLFYYRYLFYLTCFKLTCTVCSGLYSLNFAVGRETSQFLGLTWILWKGSHTATPHCKFVFPQSATLR